MWKHEGKWRVKDATKVKLVDQKNGGNLQQNRKVWKTVSPEREEGDNKFPFGHVSEVSGSPWPRSYWWHGNESSGVWGWKSALPCSLTLIALTHSHWSLCAPLPFQLVPRRGSRKIPLSLLFFLLHVWSKIHHDYGYQWKIQERSTSAKEKTLSTIEDKNLKHLTAGRHSLLKSLSNLLLHSLY